MSEQNQQDRPNKDARGRFLPGNCANPEGIGGNQKGWQPYGLRMQKWLHLDGDEVAEILGDEKRLKKLSTIDIICLKHIQATMVGDKAKEERESMLDRIEGKPDAKISIKHAGKFTFGQESVSEINSWIDGFTNRQENTVPEDTEQE